MKLLIPVFLSALFFFACKKNEWTVQEFQNDADVLQNFEAAIEIPTWTDIVYKPTLPNYLVALGMKNPVIDSRKATLGRILFYDRHLSKDQTVSCASCHDPRKAFSDNKPFSNGVEGHFASRNSSPLGNTANFMAHYQSINGAESPRLFWDNRVSTVNEQAKQSFKNPLEMDISMEEVVQRVNQQNYYPWIWQQVYGDFHVTESQVLECLAEFVGTISTYNSRIDRALEKAGGNINATTVDSIAHAYYGFETTFVSAGSLSIRENEGRKIFVANCSKCHSPIRPFQEVFAACNGLDMEYKDKGVGAQTGNPADNGVFKSPSLRNIALTAPYMHDGRFKTLEEVVEFYSSGVKNNPNLHPLMRHTGGDPNLHLTAQEKSDLVAFMNTFTDESVGIDTRYSNPFK